MSSVRLLRTTGDDALARRASSGDEEAFGVLFDRYQVRLELYCRSILRHDEDARDAAQNAMTKAFLALRGREQDVAVRAWLFRIAHNESISLMRRRRPTSELADDVAVRGDAPAEALELREELEQVLDGIRELPSRARQALLLRELADLDYASVGQVLGISPGGARQAVFEARTALQADRAGRDAPCAAIRRELSETDHRRRPARHVRGHLRGCDGCRTWSRAQDTRRRRLSLLPDGAGLAGGSAWAWLGGVLGLGAGTGAGGVVTIGAGGLALNAKVAASLAALAAGSAPVAVHEVERRLHPERPAVTPVAASPSATVARDEPAPSFETASVTPALATATTRSTPAAAGGATVRRDAPIPDGRHGTRDGAAAGRSTETARPARGSRGDADARRPRRPDRDGATAAGQQDPSTAAGTATRRRRPGGLRPAAEATRPAPAPTTAPEGVPTVPPAYTPDPDPVTSATPAMAPAEAPAPAVEGGVG